MHPSKVTLVLDLPIPKTIKQLQSFLGFANFYRRFISGYFAMALPLTTLTKKGATFNWSDTAHGAFNAMKAAFTIAPILQHFDPSQKVVLETDASDYAIGCVMSQPDSDNVLHPFAYHSRKLLHAEINYPIHDKEMLAIVVACRHWRAYLEGTKEPITIYTNHRNLQYFIKNKTLTRRHAHWSELLSGVNFLIIYRPGSAQGKTDALSRRPHYQLDSADLSLPTSLLSKMQLRGFPREDRPT